MSLTDPEQGTSATKRVAFENGIEIVNVQKSETFSAEL